MADPAQEYHRALEWIHGIGRFGMKTGLERISALLEKLGRPHGALKFVHVAGTNGKGSTAAMLASVLQAAGYRTGLYTSPYVLSFTGRMTVDGQDIPPAELVELVKRVRPLAESLGAGELGPFTEFEVVTALALLFFARRRPDLVVFEVGLGGRLDATNVVTPLVAVITNVSLEHTQVLGRTVAAVAREKAGIVKPGVPLVTAAADGKALSVIETVCRERCAPLYRVLLQGAAPRTGANDVTYARQGVSPRGQYLSYRGLHRDLDRLYIPLRGAYQAANAATALAALELLAPHGFTAAGTHLRRGLSRVRWPGRLEVLRRNPLLILDGAHNPAAMRELAAAVPEFFRYRRLILVLGILADKDVAMLEPLLALAHAVVLTRPNQPRAATPGDVAAACGSFKGPLLIEEEMERALRAALELAAPPDAVLVTGSLYTVSDARAVWETRID